jgi:hypothetical protein
MWNKIITFVVLSSTDPSKISLTIKGLAGFLVPLVVLVFGWDDTTAGAFVADLATFAAAAVALFGLGRKLWLTYIGENKALQQ